MAELNFNEKVICDNIHGSIGISKLEQDIINTRTFQRLKKIKQLGLASFVFPGAEHSRFAHSIGVMHVMSLMVNRLKRAGCEILCEADNSEYLKLKQKLRLAALLHDIGHYPLAHLGEHVFQWIEEEDTSTTEENEFEPEPMSLLQNAASKHDVDTVKHEKLGELILTHPSSELRSIISDNEFDPNEISMIINGVHPGTPFFNQLMSSTLDCDRMDYLLRDSEAAGTSYGHIDIEYIVRNIKWDKNEGLICFSTKAINAIEHFILARYFSYNVTYHKTVSGFELMAKALFYGMIREISDGNDENIDLEDFVVSFSDISDKIDNNPTFLANFNDDYFWLNLEKWIPQDEILKDLKFQLQNRIPLRIILDKRVFADTKYTTVKNIYRSLLKESEFQENVDKYKLDERVIYATNKIKFEEKKHDIPIDEIDQMEESFKIKLVKYWDETNDRASNLISSESSIIKKLSNSISEIHRIYALVDKNSEEERYIKESINKLLNIHQ